MLSPQILEKLLSTQYRDMRHSPPAKDRTVFLVGVTLSNSQNVIEYTEI